MFSISASMLGALVLVWAIASALDKTPINTLYVLSPETSTDVGRASGLVARLGRWLPRRCLPGLAGSVDPPAPPPASPPPVAPAVQTDSRPAGVLEIQAVNHSPPVRDCARPCW